MTAEADPRIAAFAPPEAVESPGHEKAILRDYIETILICVIFVIFSRAFVFQQSKIPSGSMEDTLLVGDYIMVNRFVYAPTTFKWEDYLLPTREIKRGDIVVFKQPDEPEVDYIKRVVGVPGDVVEVRRGGYLFVNGEAIEEDYIVDDYRYRPESPVQPPIEVKAGHYFVMGDHRNSSSDSRRWGQVPRALVKGRALLIWYSFNEGDPAAYPSLGQRLRAWGYKLRHFASRTRWSRCFSLIR
jgi:signal peptidase I